MSSSPTRRTVIAGAAALPVEALPYCVPAMGTSAMIGVEEWAKLAALDALLVEVDRAVDTELDLESVDEAAYRAAQERTEVVERRLSEMTMTIFSTPGSSWGNVALMARLVEYGTARNSGMSCDEHDASVLGLANGVLRMLGLTARQMPERPRIDSIPELITALGPKAIEQLGGKSTTETWIDRGFINPGWHLRIVLALAQRGERLAPDFFERFG